MKAPEEVLVKEVGLRNEAPEEVLVKEVGLRNEGS